MEYSRREPGLTRRLLLVAAATLLFVTAVIGMPPTAAASADQATAAVGHVVVSQVYGGGGNAGATYTHDFIELYNRTAAPVDLSGWSVQYASSAGSTWSVTTLSGSIAPGGHYLVQQAAGAGGTTPLPTPDATGSTAMSGTAGKVALVEGTTALSASCPVGLPVIDFVGYGTAANCFEGAGPTPTLSNTTAALRNDNGAVDTDNNAADFTIGSPNPRNSGGGGGATGPVVSQVYGGGGNAGATYTHDFIELHNPGASAVNVTGWSVQYASSAGSTWAVTTLSGSIPAGGYYLIQQAAGAGGTTPLPTPDATGSSAMAAGAGKVALSSTAVALTGTCPTGDPIVDFVGYGTAANCFEGTGPTGNLSNTTAALRNGNGAVDTDDNAADFTIGAPNPRNSGGGGGPPPIGACGDPATMIHTIQGTGPTSPLVGTSAVIEGVVVGDFQNNDQPDSGELNGFYVQEEDAQADGNPATSEGVFVFSPGAADVQVGNQVRVQGTVTEFTGSGSSQTQLSTLTGLVVCAASVALPAVTPVTFPLADANDLEWYEGMRVSLTQTLVISEYFNFDRFNEVVVGLPMPGETRFYTPTNIVEPGAPAQALAAEYAKRRITIDDGRSNQNPDPAIHSGNGQVFNLSNLFRGGDTVTGVTGLIDHTFGLYRVQPTAYGSYTEVNERQAAPDEIGGRLRVAAFNMLNYFVTIDAGQNICGPLLNQECRGADNQTELARQRTKLLAALVGIDADVVGLIEIENTTGVEAMADVVAGLNDQLGAGTYAYIATGTIGTDAIKQGFIYRPGAVTPVGAHAILDQSVDPRYIDTANRPVLAQTFEENATGAVFTATINHLKSKGSACAGDPDTGDGQGNCNLTRKAAAEALVDWLASDPTDSGDADYLILGDLNSYAMEDPIDSILVGSDDTAGTPDDWTNLIADYGGDRAYGYVFDGQAGYLDHALAPVAMAHQVTGATEWHINADEPDILDYDISFKLPPQQALFEPNAFRSSDHDPVIVGLDLEVFDFSGILPPLSTESPNLRNAGSAIPVRFSLGGDFGSDIFAAGYPSWQACSGGAETAATLTHRPRIGAGGVYDVRVASPVAYAGTCQLLKIVLADGSTQTITIQFV